MERPLQVNLLCTLRPKPTTVARLSNILSSLSLDVEVMEPDCLSYQVWQYRAREEEEIEFVIIESWASKEALQHHHESPYVRKINQLIEDEELLAEKEVDSFLSPVGGFLYRLGRERKPLVALDSL